MKHLIIFFSVFISFQSYSAEWKIDRFYSGRFYTVQNYASCAELVSMLTKQNHYTYHTIVHSCTPEYIDDWLKGHTVSYTDYVLRPYNNDCPANPPIYPDTECPTDEPEPSLKCDSEEVNKSIQNARYACQLANPNTSIYNDYFKWSCVDLVTGKPNVKTVCNYEPNGCIVGLDCDNSQNDIEYCNPLSEDCPLPPQSDLEEEPIPPIPIILPSDPDFCSLHPDICERPTDDKVEDDPITNPNNPKPDNPNIDENSNEIVKEISISNNHLTNISSNVKNLNKDIKSQLNKSNTLLQHQLGELKNIANKQNSSGGGAGVESAVGKTNDKLDTIACLLDDSCDEEGKEKAKAQANCEQSLFECEGDVIQCVLLDIQYKDHCIISDLDKLESSLSSITQVNNVDAILQPDTIDLSKIDNKYMNGSGLNAGRGQCPPDYVFTVDIYKPVTVTIALSDLCESIRRVAPLIILFGWVSGIGLVGRLQGVF